MHPIFSRPLSGALTLSVVLHLALLFGWASFLSSNSRLPEAGRVAQVVRADRVRVDLVGVVARPSASLLPRTVTPASASAPARAGSARAAAVDSNTRQRLERRRATGRAARQAPPLGAASMPVPDASSVHSTPVPSHAIARTLPRPVFVPRAAGEVGKGETSVGRSSSFHFPGEAGRNAMASAVALPPSGERGDVSGSLGDQALQSYRLALITEAKRARRYPKLAIERAWEGVVKMTVHVTAEGGVSVAWASSSGYGLLDDQAQLMMDQAVESVDVPPALIGSAFSLELPIRFSLDEVVAE